MVLSIAISRRAVPEPVFDVYADKTEDCSNVFVDVLASLHDQQTYEEQREPEHPIKCFSRAPETEQTSAHVSYYAIEQDQNGETSSANVQQIRDPQLNVLVTHERQKEWDPGDTRLHVLFPTARNLSPIDEINTPAPGSIVMAAIAVYEVDTEEVEVKVDSGKPILGPERSTDGVFSFTNEKKSDSEPLAVGFNNASDNAFSEKAADLICLIKRYVKMFNLNKILKEFKMEQVKKGSFACEK